MTARARRPRLALPFTVLTAPGVSDFAATIIECPSEGRLCQGSRRNEAAQTEVRIRGAARAWVL